jgi:hypothetical protein
MTVGPGSIMAGLEDIIAINYEQLGPMRPAWVRNRQYPDCTEFLIIVLLKKWMGLNFLDGMGKRPGNTESGWDKLHCNYWGTSYLSLYTCINLVNLLSRVTYGALVTLLSSLLFLKRNDLHTVECIDIFILNMLDGINCNHWL